MYAYVLMFPISSQVILLSSVSYRDMFGLLINAQTFHLINTPAHLHQTSTQAFPHISLFFKDLNINAIDMFISDQKSLVIYKDIFF